QTGVPAIDVAGLLTVHQEQMVGAGAAGNVDVFAQLNIALGAENCQSTIAPVGKSVRCVPVDAHVALGVSAAQQYVAIGIQARVIWIGEVANRRSDDVCVGRACEREMLLDLVTADIAQNATIPITLKEPSWTQVPIEAVGPKPHGLHDPADGATTH